LTRLAPVAGSGALGGPLVHLDATGSTNDAARSLAGDGAPHGTVVVAERQTAGRGRQGRSWTAPPGRALTLSVLLRLDAARLDLLPLAAALAVCEACERAVAVACRVKWPNDVWIDERKAAGILIEARPQEGWAVVGIGLNVDTPRAELAPELRESATSLRISTGAPVDRSEVLAALFERLAAWISALGEPQRVAEAFRERDALYGRRITWTRAGLRETGEARGIDDDGALIVFRGDDDPVRLDAGEVHLER
jgi:BirA family transcriptional regulator, biotin operon repressor / biotin---[acetyl-CoA-carboxylase] ligase